MSAWETVKLGDVVDIFDYKRVPLSSAQRATRKGPYPYYGAQGVIDYIDEFIFDGRFILVPEDGENLRSRKLPIAYFAEGQFWVNNHAHIIKAKPGVAIDRFVQSAIEATEVAAWVTGAAQPKLSQANLREIPLRVPSYRDQQLISAILDAIDELIENNRRRVQVLEEMARAIYFEWFVHFRYPGHENARLVESALGPVPQGWLVQPMAAIASKQRHAVTSGPFGSKLGRKDYRDQGVPVLRGANLRVGGGFDEADLVYVSEEKADELRSSLTGPGDIVITQRGTLGQVGIIPPRPRFERYVLSQSQMKITTDAEVAAPGFVYAQMRSESTTRRFVAQAITAGVPHVNLALLRDFQIVVPPIAVQRMFTDTAEPLWAQALALASQRLSLLALRDFLLPKLVAGEIDITSLDLGVLVEEART